MREDWGQGTECFNEAGAIRLQKFRTTDEHR
jgi:hypothetical protein